MTNPVIRLTPEAHAIAKRYCHDHGIQVIDWASETLIAAATVSIEPVGKIEVHGLPTGETDVLEREPFWVEEK